MNRPDEHQITKHELDLHLRIFAHLWLAHKHLDWADVRLIGNGHGKYSGRVNEVARTIHHLFREVQDIVGNAYPYLSDDEQQVFILGTTMNYFDSLNKELDFRKEFLERNYPFADPARLIQNTEIRKVQSLYLQYNNKIRKTIEKLNKKTSKGYFERLRAHTLAVK